MAIHPLPTNVWDDFEKIWQPLEVKRKTLLTAAGDTERHLYFVLDGVQRAWYVHHDGREATVVFTYPVSFSGVADSFLLQKPSKFLFRNINHQQFFSYHLAAG
ncbi:MAG: hypothetical protein V4717_01415 [Bacteroidota bacterium]